MSVPTCFGSETVSYGVFINSLTHVLMRTHYFVMPVGLRNPLKNHLAVLPVVALLTRATVE